MFKMKLIFKIYVRLVMAVTLVVLTSMRSRLSSSSFIRLASGQGLSVSADNLGAGAEATANSLNSLSRHWSWPQQEAGAGAPAGATCST
jgi:hypothetical protein